MKPSTAWAFFSFIGSLLALGAMPAWAEVHYSGKTLRDPFTDPAASTSKADVDRLANDYGSLKLQGILFSQENPRAIINGKIVGVGDPVIGQAVVTAIDRDDIVLTANGKKYILKQTIRKTSYDTEPKTTPAQKN